MKLQPVSQMLKRFSTVDDSILSIILNIFKSYVISSFFRTIKIEDDPR